MKILLIVPPAEYVAKTNMPPLGLLSMSSVLEAAQFETTVIDCIAMEHDFKKLRTLVSKEKTEIVCITATTYSRHDALKTAKLAKNENPNSIVVVGGVHFSFTADETLKHIKEIDIVARGEGEYTILDLARAVQNNLDLKNILGISYRYDGKIVHNPDRPFIRDLDRLPFPDRKKISLKKYNQTLEFVDVPCTSVMTSRGCPIKCAFCSTSVMWGHAHRTRSPENIVDEIECLLNEYRLEGINFVDDTLTLSQKHILGLCREIEKRKLDFKWFCDIRVDNVNKEILKEMKNAGCYYVGFGVESGSPNVLQLLNKKITLDQVKKCARNCKELGIKTKAFFTYSNPGETENDLEMTFRFMDKLEPCVDIIAPSVLTIFPGTYLEIRAKKIGSLPSDFSWDAPYYSKKNEIVGQPPNIPVYIENFDIDTLIKIRTRLQAREVARNEEFTPPVIFKKGMNKLVHARNLSELKTYGSLGLYSIQEIIRQYTKNKKRMK